MHVLRPQHYGPYELILHGKRHLEISGDFDKRIAMISFDNSIETSISVYLTLYHPKKNRLHQIY